MGARGAQPTDCGDGCCARPASAVYGSSYACDGVLRCFCEARCMPVEIVCFGSYDMIVDDGGWERLWMTLCDSMCLFIQSPPLIPACSGTAHYARRVQRHRAYVPVRALGCIHCIP